MLATIPGQGNPNFVLGNLIGTDISGEQPVGNIVGIYINGAAGNEIGGTESGAGNIISGNSSVGVEIFGSASAGNVVEGNTIGLAANGRGVFRDSRGLFTQREGIFILNASANMIGGCAWGGKRDLGQRIGRRLHPEPFRDVQRQQRGRQSHRSGAWWRLAPETTDTASYSSMHSTIRSVAPDRPRTASAESGIADFRDFRRSGPASRGVTVASRSRLREPANHSTRKAAHPAGPARHGRSVPLLRTREESERRSQWRRQCSVFSVQDSERSLQLRRVRIQAPLSHALETDCSDDEPGLDRQLRTVSGSRPD